MPTSVVETIKIIASTVVAAVVAIVVLAPQLINRGSGAAGSSRSISVTGGIGVSRQ